MLKIKSITIKSLNISYLNLWWEIEDTFHDPYDFTFTIERSEGPAGPFDQISQPMSDKYYFRDIDIRPFHPERKLWYRIKTTRKSDNNVIYSEAVSPEPKPDKIALEVRRMDALTFYEHIGRLAWVFPVRTFGQRCPGCFDTVTKSRIRSNCIDCFNTGYAYGYFDPIIVPMQIDAFNHTDAETNTRGKLPYFPPVKKRDMIVEAENIRWQVTSVVPLQRLRTTFRQEIEMHMIPKSDAEYRIPVNIDDLSKYEASPHREFTNPHTLKAANNAVWPTQILRGHGYE